MSIDLFEVGFIVYLLCGIITFGHAYNHIEVNYGDEVIGGMFCGMGFPLYWAAHFYKSINASK